MSEKFAQFISPIEAESVEDHERLLRTELSRVQLAYADRLFDSHTSFTKILKKIDANIYFDLKSIYSKEHTDQNKEEVKIQREQYLQHHRNIIDEIYLKMKATQGDFIGEIINYIEDLKSQSMQNYPEGWVKQESPINKIGSLKYIINPDLQITTRNILNKLGIERSEQLLEMHLEPHYMDKDNPLKNIMNDLSMLSEIIIDNYPFVNTIVARSWMFSHLAVKRLIKFEVIEDARDINWNQFIDQDGQIQKDRVEHLLETREAPYRNLIIKIDIESFLNEFLPKERRGEIDLMDINPEWQKCYSEEKFTEDSKEFRKALEDLKEKSKEGIENIFNQLPRFKDVWERLSLYDKLVEILVSSEKQDKKTLYNNNLDFFKQTEQSIKEYFSKIVLPEKFITNKVLIN